MQFLFKLFKITHIFIRMESFFKLDLIRYYQILDSNTQNHLYLNFYLIYLMKNLEIRGYQIKVNLLLVLKLIYFSNPFGMAFILRLNLPSSCIIRFFRFWNVTWILWFILTLILQSLRVEPQHFPATWQWFLTLTSLSI